MREDEEEEERRKEGEDGREGVGAVAAKVVAVREAFSVVVETVVSDAVEPRSSTNKRKEK